MTIDILTTTRAEYGVMKPLIKKMNDDPDIEVNILVTGTHLSESFGYTYKNILSDGFEIFEKLPIMSEKVGPAGVSETMANAIRVFSDFFERHRPDFLLVDGDRFETLAVCTVAVNYNIPIIHVGGGSTTEGAADEYYRHAITKLSYIHFATMDVYRKRIIQMGENPDRVFLVGSPLIENIMNTDFISKAELSESLGFNLDMPFAVVTFHPVTLENSTALQQVKELEKACEEISNMKFIFTMANADNGGEIINQEIISFAEKFDRAICVPSLGSLRYLSALNEAAMVIGNSSSGIIEAPSFHIPTINIGDRQKGRVQAQSVINCDPNKESILEAVKKARSSEFQEVCKCVKNPNGDGNTSDKIICHIKEVWNKSVNIKKKFYDLY